MNRDRIEKLLSGLRMKYPAHIWAAAYPSLPIDEWTRELRPYTPDHIKHALGNLRSNHSLHPPTAMQFANLCDGYGAGRRHSMVECTAAECIIKTNSGRCALHPASMSYTEDLIVSAGIKRNFDVVQFYLFLRRHTRPHEIYDPKPWGWPDCAIDGIRKYPMLDGENAGDYLNRIASLTAKMCGMDAEHLAPPMRQRKSQLPYRESFTSVQSTWHDLGFHRGSV